jgi:hypothetical protein
MSRRQEYLEGPEAHLEHGMKHVGYDADAQTHTYRDLEGNLWESKPGNQYGPLKMTYSVKRAHKNTNKSSSSKHSSSSTSYSHSGEKKGGLGNLLDKLMSGAGDKSEDMPPPPPYTRRSRRFTSFDMLDRGMLTTEDQIQQEEQAGVLGKLGRSLSIRKNNQNNGRPQRRSTVATSSVSGRWRSGTV